VQDILGAVLKSEPDWTRLPAETPSGIRKLLRLCLEKDVKNRRRDAGDVRIDIEQALAEPVTRPVRENGRVWIPKHSITTIYLHTSLAEITTSIYIERMKAERHRSTPH
jgi:hypothetical protein